MKNGQLIRNTVLLTASYLVMQGIGMIFQVWLAGQIGAAGIGLFQLTLSVSGLAATFAVSGVRFAATRLVAEELGAENAGGVRAALLRCLGYAAFFGTAALMILFFLARPIGLGWIRDGRTVSSLRLSAFSLPCISLCSAVSGYFTACGRVWKPTLIHLLEQLVGIALTVRFLRAATPGDLEQCCAAVTRGRVAADLISLALMLTVCFLDLRRHSGGCEEAKALTGRMLRIALPLAVSAYARSALNTLQHLMVPRGLRAAGFSADGALAGYGVVQGMALPILLFPSCLLSSLAELSVPTLTERQIRGDREGIRAAVGALLKFSLGFSAAAALFLFLTADALGFLIYQNSQAGQYIRILAPLIPVLYTDLAADGCLKGLGEQLWCMGVNTAESLLGLLLVWKLLPRYALSGYLSVVYVTEIFNFSLSLLRLRRILLCAPGADHPPYGGPERCAYTAAASAGRPPRP